MGDEVLKKAESGDAIALAQALVRTPSVNPVLEASGSGEERVAELVRGWLEAWGFEARADEVAPGRWNAVGVLEGQSTGRTVLLNGHLDTVGVEGMTIDPFSGDLVEGPDGRTRLLGRGSCDMKGGDASLLSAAAAIARDGLPAGRLIIALTGDEEHASVGMQALVDQLDDGVDVGVVCEPTELAVMPAHKGFIWIDHHFVGRAAHGSRPEEGVDAIEHAGRYLALLAELRADIAATEPHHLVGHGSFHAGTIQGGEAASVYPADCRLVVERRTIPGETPESVMAEFDRVAARAAELIEDLNLEVTRGLTRPASDVPVESPLVQGLLDALVMEDQPSAVGPMTAWVDAAFLNEAGIPAVCFGPGSIAQAHTADEWCDAEQIEICARVLERFTRTFLAG